MHHINILMLAKLHPPSIYALPSFNPAFCTVIYILSETKSNGFPLMLKTRVNGKRKEIEFVDALSLTFVR